MLLVNVIDIYYLESIEYHMHEHNTPKYFCLSII